LIGRPDVDQLGTPQDGELPDQLRALECLRHRRLDVMTERLEQSGRRLGRGDTLGVDVTGAERVLRDHADAQLPRIGTELLHVGAQRRRGDDGIAGRRPTHRVEHGRGVAHRAADAQLGDERIGEVAPFGAE
jgi:hypothetical protein